MAAEAATNAHRDQWMSQRARPELHHNIKAIMNKDQVNGAIKDAAGKVQETAGQVIDSSDQQAKGLLKQGEGKVQKTYGDVKEALKEATKK
jgi:uncharacterized protein YjbJ (UPF0337 family)